MSSIYQAENLKLNKKKNGNEWVEWVTECKLVHRSFDLKINLLVIMNIALIILHLIHYLMFLKE